MLSVYCGRRANCLVFQSSDSPSAYSRTPLHNGKLGRPQDDSLHPGGTAGKQQSQHQRQEGNVQSATGPLSCRPHCGGREHPGAHLSLSRFGPRSDGEAFSSDFSNQGLCTSTASLPWLSTFHHRAGEASSLGAGTEHKGKISLGPWRCGGTRGKSKEMGKGSQHTLNS